MILVLCACGCSGSTDFVEIDFQVEPDCSITYNYSNNKYNVRDHNDNLLAEILIQLGSITIEKDNIVRMQKNSDFILSVYMSKELSGENLKFYYNDTLFPLTEYDSDSNCYNFNFSTGEQHKLKLEGLSFDVKREMNVTLPASNEEYTITHKNTVINEDNKVVSINYGENLIVTVEMNFDVDPTWTLAFQEPNFAPIEATVDETTVVSDKIKIFTYVVKENITVHLYFTSLK